MAQSGLSVLIIDDNPRLVKDYSEFLRENNVHVFVADDGPHGVKQAEHHKPDVILLDLMLPEMNGIQTLKELKKHEKTQNIPVIVITALVEDQQKEESLKAGALEYVAKVDLEPDDLLNKIKNAAAINTA